MSDHSASVNACLAGSSDRNSFDVRSARRRPRAVTHRHWFRTRTPSNRSTVRYLHTVRRSKYYSNRLDGFLEIHRKPKPPSLGKKKKLFDHRFFRSFALVSTRVRQYCFLRQTRRVDPFRPFPSLVATEGVRPLRDPTRAPFAFARIAITPRHDVITGNASFQWI